MTRDAIFFMIKRRFSSFVIILEWKINNKPAIAADVEAPSQAWEFSIILACGQRKSC